MSVKTEEDLANAINNNEETIEVEGDLRNKVLKIKATGKVAWGVVIGSVAIAVTAIIVTAGTGAAVAPVSIPTSAFAATGAVSVIGLGATTTAIALAVAAGGVGVLNKLRKYKIIETTNTTVVLKRS